ncbi:DUF423 domain-containing protein [Adhaeribacter pallidiroseus]|uniref:Proline--tRNA ligase n=1 Tax=Adhaeribacter pallidiroseus TaxID=2072847 RepID=A0A369QE74_9BACT|nr:DUF423 domain-containing protein [Adhaeribacter pallidiroseus]RDC62610.1 Proline--tRNA ligase [Adhaeribacter pallidiroseus]
MNYKQSLLIAALLGAITVAIGAFGAHALRPGLEAAGRLDTFETGVKYQMYHTLAIFLTGLLQIQRPHKLLNRASLFFLLGILIFSGSLYTLSLSGITKLGAFAPIGGVLLIVGWICLAFSIAKLPDSAN